MKKQSIWMNEYKNKINKLNKDIECDVLIIGGGITGLTTAYHLMNKNLKVVIVEKNQIGCGTTAKSTAKITYLQDLIYTKLKDKALPYLKYQLEAINTITKTIEKENIDCDLEKVESRVINKNKDKLIKEKNILESFGINVKLINNYIKVDNTYVFHPIKYLLKLKEILLKNNIEIYEKTNVIKIHDLIYTDKYKIKAKKIVLACHYPFFLFPLLTPIHCYLERSYICSIKNKTNQNFSLISNNPVISMRYYKDNLIYLIGSHNINNKYNETKNFDKLIKQASKFGKIEYIWSNHDIITNDNLPIIGKINNRLLIGTGYNTWGMTNGTLAGKILSEIILNDKYYELFDPKRNLIFNINNLANILSTSKAYIENKIILNKKWNKNVIFTKINDDSVGIYIDNNKKKHIVYNKCPHLGCNLLFNDVELTWDCPCHGSRFDIDGNCIMGPSCHNIKYKKQ